MNEFLPQDLGFDLVRATEEAALKAGRWKGLGKPDEADQAATEAIFEVLNTIEIDGRLVIVESTHIDDEVMMCGTKVGCGEGAKVDVVCDPIDGRQQLAMGQAGALSVIAIAPAGSMWAPTPAAYMDKIVVNHEAASALVPECMDAPPAWTLALVASAKSKSVSDLTVFILDRPRHADLIAEVRSSGARGVLRPDGDIAGALMACVPDSQVDLLMGIGGVLEGLIVACAVKALGGAMLGRLAPQSERERQNLEDEGQEINRILTDDQLVSSKDVFFSATGITTSPLLSGIRYHGERANSNSLILRGITMTRRDMYSEHQIQLSDQTP
ncbi:MAG: class II fructose-bisphosphatase [Chloroflexota bacterium]|nr:class II fructose-bisphosphatase [Chloroflexota bacterium]